MEVAQVDAPLRTACECRAVRRALTPLPIGHALRDRRTDYIVAGSERDVAAAGREVVARTNRCRNYFGRRCRHTGGEDRRSAREGDVVPGREPDVAGAGAKLSSRANREIVAGVEPQGRRFAVEQRETCRGAEAGRAETV